MIKLIASDLDGTILDNNFTIPQENIQAIDDLKNSDIPLVVCTGKTYGISKDICAKLHASFGIFSNGSQIIDLTTGKEIYKSILSLDEIKSCFSIAKKFNVHIHAYTEKSIITSDLKYMDLRAHRLFSDELTFNIVDSVLDYIIDNKLEVLKLSISSTSPMSEIKNQLKQIPNISITHISRTGLYRDKIIDKEYEYLDISSFNSTKGHALKYLGSYLEVNKENILAIGDNINDIDMFYVSGIGVALNNAYDEVKKAATYISSNNAENAGFAETVYRFIELNK